LSVLCRHIEATVLLHVFLKKTDAVI